MIGFKNHTHWPFLHDNKLSTEHFSDEWEKKVFLENRIGKSGKASWESLVPFGG